MSSWSVVPITKQQADAFVLQKHYSRRASIFWCAFGLVIDGRVEGVVVYGQPSPPIQRHAFKDRDFRLYELSRLVIQTQERNAASYLVGTSLRMLEPKPCAVVSYADMEQSHCGIVYQATNWLYTGATKSHDKAYIVDGKRTHPMTLRDQGITDPTRWAKENGIEMVKPAEKHRYFYLVGSKAQKRTMLGKLTYPIVSTYPKCDQNRYNDGPTLVMGVADNTPQAAQSYDPRHGEKQMTNLIPHVQIPPQTHSSLQTFDLCPRQYDAKYRTKSVKFVQSYEGEWGDKAHNNLETYIKSSGKYQYPSEVNKDTGQNQTDYAWIGETILTRARNRGGYVLAERNFAIGYDRDTADYWDKKGWLRGKIDVTVIYPERREAEVYDLKTGKKKDDPLQLDLYSVSAMLDYCNVDRVRSGYIWSKLDPTKAIDKPRVYTRDDIQPILNTFESKTREVQHAWDTGTFPPKPNFLCKNWCDAPCEFNGRGIR